MSYLWSQTAGTAVTLANSNTAIATFTRDMLTPGSAAFCYQDDYVALMFERNDLDNRTQALNYMHVGVLNKDHHRPGMFGELYLDEFELNREPATISETR